MSSISTTRINSIPSKPLSYQYTLFGLFAFILFTAVFYIFPPQAVDWHRVFYQVSLSPLHPYDIDLFINPPWTALILHPFSYFQENIALAVNSSLSLLVISLLVIKRGDDKLSLLLTLTSFPFISMIANGNIEWIPALGFILGNRWGIPLLMTKPQTGILAILAWQPPSIKNWLHLATPALSISVISLAIWGNWPAAMLSNIQAIQAHQAGMSTWNVSLFPWSIPVGLGLLFALFKGKMSEAGREILGVLATLCLVPYFSIYSITILFALVSASHKRIGVFLWILSWGILIGVNWDFISKLL